MINKASIDAKRAVTALQLNDAGSHDLVSLYIFADICALTTDDRMIKAKAKRVVRMVDELSEAGFCSRWNLKELRNVTDALFEWFEKQPHLAICDAPLNRRPA